MLYCEYQCLIQLNSSMKLARHLCVYGYRWDPVTRSWSLVAPMQSQRCTAGVAVLNGRLYAVGGRDGASCLRTVECYDPHTNKWTPCAPMTRRRGGVGVGVANGFLYALGGQDAPANNPAASRFDCVERYDPGKFG